MMSPISVFSDQSMLPLDPKDLDIVEAFEEAKNQTSPNNAKEVAEEKTRRGTVSIDVTKALLLLGFTSWSGIEKDVEKGNVELVEAKLSKVVADKVKERQEYLALIDATKDLNFDLYQKMVYAGAKRTDALTVHDPISHENHKTPIECNSKINPKHPPQSSQLARNNKLTRGKRGIKKGGQFSDNVASNDINQNIALEKKEDEEEQSLHWAYSILMKEFHRRNNLRGKNKVSSKKANDKLNSFLAFKKLKEEHQRKEKKKGSSDKQKLDQSSLTKPVNIENIKDSSNGNIDTNIAEELKELKKVKISTDEIAKKNATKKSVEIINLQDQIQSKKKLVTESNETSSINQIFKSKTEKEKIKEARKTLLELTERAERKNREKELEGKMEGIGNTDKETETKLRRNINGDKPEKDSEDFSNNNIILSKNVDELPFESCIKSIKQESNNYAVDIKNVNITKEDKKKVIANRNKMKQKRLVMENNGITKGKNAQNDVQYHSRNIKASSSSNNDNAKIKIKKASKKQISSSKLPKNDPTCFESFVQEKLKQQGYTLSKEEENLVREAIEKTVAEE